MMGKYIVNDFQYVILDYMKIFILLLSYTLFGAGLKAYKDQKHGKRKRVTNCPQDYVARCLTQCQGDHCQKKCEGESHGFCKKRKKRRFKKKLEIIGKGATVIAPIAGAAATGGGGDRPKGKLPPSVVRTNLWWGKVEAKAGYIEAGAVSTGLEGLVSYGLFGLQGNIEYLADGSVTLVESMLGPNLSLPGAGFIGRFSPGIIMSTGNEVHPEYGFGAKGAAEIYLRGIAINAAFMLGHINSNWNYHLKMSAGIAFAPKVYIMLGYEYRDVVDLNDLDISKSTLQGVFGYLQYLFY